MKLHISKDLSLPIDVVTQKLAWMGRTGSGKTYGFLKLAEEMLAHEVQVVILDPVGVHWGLRLSRDGKSDGIQTIYVFGGLHADCPLEAGSGKMVADFLADRHVSAILDVSQFESDTEKTRFAADWADRFFFRWKSAPSPVHIGLEECQEFVPQNPMKGEERMIHVFNRMWKLGRNFGIGGSLISQRPQEVNKKSLNLTECFFAFQMTGPHERKTVQDWMRGKGVDDTIASDLPKLAIGQPHIWSPQWLRISETIRIGERWTYDASSTPRFGAKPVSTRPLSPADLEKLSVDLQRAVAKAKENDPEALKRRIRELERKLTGDIKQKADGITIDRAMMQRLQEAHDEAFTLNGELQKKIDYLEQALKQLQKRMADAAYLLAGKQVDTTSKISARVEPHPMGSAVRVLPPVPPATRRIFHEINKEFEAIEGKPSTDIKLRDGARRMLAALVQWYPEWMQEGQMRAHAGLKKSGTFSAYKTDLRWAKFVEENNGFVRATQAGIDWLGHDIPSPSTTQEVVDVWYPKLRSGARRMLDILIKYRGDPIPDEQLQGETGLAKSGTYSAYKTDLRTARLIITKNGMVAANKETLFL